MKRIVIKDLAYWKGALMDAQAAAQDCPRREFWEAVRFAARKVHRLEQKAFHYKRNQTHGD